jgi:uncharacterized protein
MNEPSRKSSVCTPLGAATVMGLAVAGVLLAQSQSLPNGNNSKYYLVLLSRPAGAPTLGKKEAENLQEQHMANIKKMARDHKIVIAGPFIDDTDLRGVFVFQADSVAEAADWAASDPAIQAGHLVAEIHGPWLIDSDLIHPSAESSALEHYSLVLMKRADKWKVDAVGFNFVMRDYPPFTKEMLAQGYVALGGVFPFNVPGSLRAVTIFRVGTGQTATLLKDDPTVKEGLLTPEIHPWLTGQGVLAPGQPAQ